MAKVLCVLYPDPVDGYPDSYARTDLPVLERYPNGQTLPTPTGARLHAGTNCSAASPASSACGTTSRARVTRWS